MTDNVLKTGVDELYELVMSRKKISVEEIAKILKIPDDTVQALVDFLVEEKIFGIEYKFTTPYVYISHEKGRKIYTNVHGFIKIHVYPRFIRSEAFSCRYWQFSQVFYPKAKK